METASNALSHIRKESLDIYNRLHSIKEDVEFVNQVHETLILVDSTRSGKRIPDALSKTVPIWCAVINRALVKRYPELHSPPSSSEGAHSWDTSLYTPPSVVPSQEHNSILAKLDGWAEALANSSFDLPKLPYPLRPIWITPSMSTFPPITLPPPPTDNHAQANGVPRFIPIICVSASKQVQDGTERRAGGFSYIQGSGDDHELWGMGLTPELFWSHKDELLSSSRSDLPEIVEDIVSSASSAKKPSPLDSSRRSSSPTSPSSVRPLSKKRRPTPVVKVGGRIWIGKVDDVEGELLKDPHGSAGGRARAYIVIHEGSEDEEGTMIESIEASSIQASTNSPASATPSASSKQVQPTHILSLPIPSSSKSKPLTQQYFLHTILPRSLPFMDRYLRKGWDVCIVCPTGKDLSVGVGLVGVGVLFDDQGALKVPNGGEGDDGDPGPSEETEWTRILERATLTKKDIKTRLEWIIASRPEANPARATLKRVNEFLFTPREYWER
ncbi:tRNA a64-2'-O-ribosylphosphate transferase [Coprinopsis cinerea okayama7|uniref:tRNA a64-2'-O-ribosylphosphate transferase n=1 Tax=Coprinopsis cinerea (strain Okayama-7 / 130 / ATCC MYA-4618 / FGSC 9003) TaxID=240176 RepID=A8N4X1_COPC7|nr:tRNA a64-2'-O-ribosylphosphate transferase [Coprinopsis cinerea okayama7\|eukprot:XP_001829982.2 tRNA a64-2'-O-ribosylphosphate transferase [Coprinopsis cinerea okayama7\